jgi:hypothetical protein
LIDYESILAIDPMTELMDSTRKQKHALKSDWKLGFKSLLKRSNSLIAKKWDEMNKPKGKIDKLVILFKTPWK